MCNITWLQLSDLHFGYSDQTVRNMREKLKSDAIKNVVSHQIRYQFLIIVGDIVYARCSDIEKAYDEAADYIKDIQKLLDIKKSNTYVVPGNHDIDLSNENRTLAISLIRKDYLTRRGKLSEVADISELHPNIYFQNFYKIVTGSRYPSGHIMHKPKNQKIDFLCLDSSYTCLKSKEDFGRLVLGMESVSDALSKHNKDRKLIVISHHGLDWLTTEERKSLTDKLVNHNTVVFCSGHIHTAEAAISDNYLMAGSSFTLSVSPTFMDEDDSGRLTDMGYNIGLLDVDNGSVFIESYKWEISMNIFNHHWKYPYNGSFPTSANPLNGRRGVRLNSCELFLYREKRGLRIEELAKAIGMNEKRLKQYEVLDHRFATDSMAIFPECQLVDDIIKLSFALSIDPEVLVAKTSYLKDNTNRYEHYCKRKGLRKVPPAREKTKVVVFDFDGTLTQNAFLKSSWERMWVSCDYDVNDCRDLHDRYEQGEFSHQTWCDLTAENFIAKGFGYSNLESVASEVELIDDCKDVLKQLNESNIELYIVSGSVLELIKIVLGEELVGLFREIRANQMMFDHNKKLTRIVGTKYDFEGKGEYVKGIISRGHYSPNSIVFFGNSFNDHSVCSTGVKAVCINPKQTQRYDATCWTCSELGVTSIKQFLTYIDS